MDYRVVKKSIRVESRGLYELTCAYDENCLSSTAAHYIHYPNLFHRTLLRFTSRFWNRGTDSFEPDVSKENWQWHTCHRHYHSMERFTDYDLIGTKIFYTITQRLLLSIQPGRILLFNVTVLSNLVFFLSAMFAIHFTLILQ